MLIENWKNNATQRPVLKLSPQSSTLWVGCSIHCESTSPLEGSFENQCSTAGWNPSRKLDWKIPRIAFRPTYPKSANNSALLFAVCNWQNGIIYVWRYFARGLLCRWISSCGHFVNSRGQTLLHSVGKARVAPMKAMSIFKLELQAALLATLLNEDIFKALTNPINDVFMWTDSTIGLQWLHLSSKCSIFVANEVSEILEVTTIDEWYHVDAGNNPADTDTEVSKLSRPKLWKTAARPIVQCF